MSAPYRQCQRFAGRSAGSPQAPSHPHLVPIIARDLHKRPVDSHEYGAQVVVMGQVAGIMHGSRELTGDLDLLWDGEARQADALAAAYASVSADLTDDDGVPVRCEPGAFGLPKVLFRSTGASGDCCTPALPWGDLPIADFLARCRVATCDGFEIRYLDRVAGDWHTRLP